jgi:hypothetical protein
MCSRSSTGTLFRCIRLKRRCRCISIVGRLIGGELQSAGPSPSRALAGVEEREEKGLGQFGSWAMVCVGLARARRRQRERRGEPGLLFGWAGPRERKERFSLFYFQKFY